MNVDKSYFRQDTPLVGVPPFGQVHAHSTANNKSMAKEEAGYMSWKDLRSGFFTHVVGNGKIYQTAATNRGAWDVGGGWNSWGYASVELIESHKTKAEFMTDYKIYVNLLRELAVEAGVPLTLDTSEYGVVTHQYCTNNQPNNQSDHGDPYSYLAKWGISKAQFQSDVKNGINTVEKPKSTVNNVVQVLDSKAFKTFTTYDGNGKANEGSWITPESKWVSNSIQVINGKPYFVIGSNIYLPQSSTTFKDKLVINGDQAESVDSKGVTISGSNKKFKAGSEWKTVDKLVNIPEIGWCYQVATNEYIPAKYQQGSGFKG